MCRNFSPRLRSQSFRLLRSTLGDSLGNFGSWLSTSIVTVQVLPVHPDPMEKSSENATNNDRIAAAGSSPNNRLNAILPYVCVFCNTPCAALYRRLSVSLSSIKAMNCTKCYKMVDPYIEREWLLVVIDCILLREEAFRHVLYNVDDLKDIPIPTLAQVVIGLSTLDAYLKWQTISVIDAVDSGQLNMTTDSSLVRFSLLVLSSSLGTMLQWLIMQLFHTRREEARVRMKLFWGLVLPRSFAVVTIFVSTWENTKIVVMLGSLLIACWQGMAIWVATNDLYTPMLGFLTGILWRLLLSIVYTHQCPCLGFQLTVLSQNYPLCIT